MSDDLIYALDVGTRKVMGLVARRTASGVEIAALCGLIVTRGHRHDALVLRHWINRDFAFLGMIGSKRKARTIRDHFLAEKIGGEEALERLSCPVGVDIAAHTVPEIAISILAEYIDQRAAYVAQQNTPPILPEPAPGPARVGGIAG